VKILYLTQFFRSTGGGGEVVFHQWAHELSRRGNEIFVICQQKGKDCPECLSLGIHVIGIPPYLDGIGGLPPTLRHNLGYLMISSIVGRSLVHSSQIDVVHSNNFTPIMAGSAICWNTRIPHIATVHDVYTSAGFWRRWSSQFQVSSLSALLGPLVERVTLKAPVRLFHTVSERSRKDMLEFGVNRPIVVIPNGINESKWAEVNPTIATDTSKPTVLSIGRLVFYKNLEVVISAFVEVIKEVPAARLVVLGDGPMRETWTRYAHDLGLDNTVSFKGYVSEKEKARFLHDSALLVFPTTIEGFGFAILEAFACSKPVIASNIEPLTDLVRSSFNGFLANPRDPLDWSTKVTYLLKNISKATEFGQNGRKLVESNYSIGPNVDRLVRLYRRVLE